MFKLAALAGIAAAAKPSKPWDSPDEVPEEYQWALECEHWEDAPYEKYQHFEEISKAVDNRDVCLLVSFHMLAIADLHTSLNLSKCEWSYVCLGMGYEEGINEDDVHAVAEECVKIAQKHLPEKGVGAKDLAMMCADQFPNLDGTPFE